MNAAATIDAERVHALNRLIREKTGRADSAPERIAAPRKNLWLQVPAAGPGSAVKPRQSRQRATVAGRRSDNHSAPKTPIAQRIRRTLTVLLSAVLLLTTAATAVDRLADESTVPQHAAPSPAMQSR